MNLLRRVNIIILLLAYVNCSFAQEIDLKFNHLTVEQGLSHNNVYGIIQDNDGFMWFATQDGLNRYDGYSFEVFRHNPINANSLSSSNFGKIYQDKSGKIWCGTYGGGLDEFDPHSNLFVHHKHSDIDSTSISNDKIRFIFEDTKNQLWVGTSEGGVNVYNRDTKIFTKYLYNPNDDNTLSDNRAKCICEDSSGTIWIGTYKGLNKFDGKTKKFTRIKLDKKETSEANKVEYLFVDGKIMWISTRGGGLGRYNLETNKIVFYKHDPKNKYSIQEDRVEFLFKDSFGNFWIGTYFGGLCRFDIKTNRFYNYQYDIGNIYSLSHNRVEYICEDKSHNLWIATRGGGINKLDLKPKKFNGIAYNPKKKNSLPHPNVLSITQDKEGYLWVGTDGGGLTKIDRKNNRYTNFKHKSHISTSISQSRIWSICIDKSGSLWAGTYSEGLNKMILKNGKYEFIRYKHDINDSNSISGNQINVIFQDDRGTIWVGTKSGLNKIIYSKDSSKVIFKHFRHQKNNPKSLRDDYISEIYQDKLKNLWIGTYVGGLNKFDYKTEAFQTINIDSKLQSSFRVEAITEDNNGVLWIGSEGGGIFEYDPKEKQIKQYCIDNEYSSNVILSILYDDFKYLWMGTSNGLLKFNIETKEIKNYTIFDGLLSNGFSRGACIKNNNGEMFFGCISGLSYFVFDEVHDNEYIPQIQITDFKIFNDSYWSDNKRELKRNIIENKEIELSYKDYVFSFVFSSLDYTVTQKNRYKYKLQGFDEKWVYTDKNEVTYTNLDPGNYNFVVKGSNSDGVWNETGISVKIIIKPPLWKKPWFYALELITLILIIILYNKIREKKLISDKKELEKNVKERTSELRQKNEEIEAQAEYLEHANKELEKLSIVASKTDNAIVIMDSKGNFEWVNDGFVRMYGYNLEQLVKEKDRNFVGASSNLQIQDLINIWYGDKKPIVYEALNKTRDGKEMWAQTTLTPILDNNNNILKLIAIDTDITKLKEADEQIMQKNIDITDSLSYAKRIQQSIMTPVNELEKYIENFILLRPKDIVSGDFYWFSKKGKKIIVAVADCTGHGVPGAFMSMLGISFLNKIIKERNIIKPKSILERLRHNVISSLKQTGKSGETSDGMDIAVITIDLTSNILEYSGALIPLYIIRNNELLKILPDRVPIGIYLDIEPSFTHNEMKVQKNDVIYMFSDGYADQFGGEKDNRFKLKNLKKLLLKIHNKELSEQKIILHKNFEEWKGEGEQVDDVLVVGLKV
ncbi:MAG: SpoIIE family protein phosphatase [Bacteroidetes bacterium]|nr:SpoIIE family protein phosphatase [Bacteroidota bacterium]